MREIKFRGKMVHQPDTWVYGSLNVTKLAYWICCDNGEDHQVFSETVGQFTGLKDRLGIEIYEGDIVKFRHSTDRVYDAVGKVEYVPHWCGFYFAGNRGLSGRMSLKIIGNAYEEMGEV